MTTIKVGKVPPAAKRSSRYDANGLAKPDCWEYTEEDLHHLQSLFKLLLDAEPWDNGKMSKEEVLRMKEAILKPFRAQAVAIHERRIKLNAAAVRKVRR